MPKDLNLSYLRVDAMIKRIYSSIHKSPDSDRIRYVVAIMRGGKYPAKKLAEKMKAIVGTVRAKSYTRRSRGEVIISSSELFLRAGFLEGPILLVDDIYDTGKTMVAVTGYLKDLGFKDIRTAVLISKSKVKRCDYEGEFVSDKKRWVVFPWEKKSK